MLKKILSITGRSGLFEIVAQGRNMILVEDLITKKRFPASMRDKIVALADISMYTDAGDVPLGEILTRVYEKQNSQKIDIAKLSKENSLGAAFEAIVPDYDKMRVYNSDIKKLFTWYNILLDAGYTSFLDKPEETSSDSDSEPAQEETPAEEQ